MRIEPGHLAMTSWHSGGNGSSVYRRYRWGALNRLNERLMAELQLGGRVFPSNAVINGRFAIRACIVNYRTEAVDVDALVEEAVEKGSWIHEQHAVR